MGIPKILDDENRFPELALQQNGHVYNELMHRAAQPRLVDRAEEWRWSSLALRTQRSPPTILAPTPVKLPRNWCALVNRPQTESELAALRRSVARGAPLGSDAWQRRTAARLGLEHSLRPRGRPRKHEEK